MVDINGYEISKAFTGGEPVSAIYSFGEKVWPNGPEPIEFGGLKFTALEAGEIHMTHSGTGELYYKPSFSYSKDGVNWYNWNYYSNKISVVAGDNVYFKGINDTISSSDKFYYTFTSTCKIAASGNIMSLLYGDDYEGKLSLSGKYYCFTKLFYNCTNLITAPELPATTLEELCYSYMFRGCTSLTTAPKLPATTLSPDCYSYMFRGCTGLTNAPSLPATILKFSCYGGMFYGCTSLTNAPELPATKLEPACYFNMFRGCTSLTTAPELPSTELAVHCYSYMFYGCRKLNYVKANFIEDPSSDSDPSNWPTGYWLSGVASTGTFVANPSATWTTSISRNESTVPAGWTITK